MRTLLTWSGTILVVLGILFAAQGAGYFPWPAESFMVGNGDWVFYGSAVGVVGLLIIFAAAFAL